MTDAEWILHQWQKAQQECSRCRGRECGDCLGPVCRWWNWTKSENEEAAVAAGAGLTNVSVLSEYEVRDWLGPISISGWKPRDFEVAECDQDATPAGRGKRKTHRARR